MSFLERAKQAASQAAEGAKQAAEQARTAASETAVRAQTAINDPGNAEKAKGALSRARSRVSTAIDRIDPAVLADVIIKATALQERANAALKAKGSPYRIAEVVIGAAIPPSISFSIARTHDIEEDVLPEGAVTSMKLVAEGDAGGSSTVALDGSTIDDSTLFEAADAS